MGEVTDWGLANLHRAFPLPNAPEADEDDADQFPQNTSGIEPTGYRVLILPDEVKGKIGNVYIPDQTQAQEKGAQMRGTLIARGAWAFTEGGSNPMPERDKLVPGARVLFAKYAGAYEKGDDGKDYRVVEDKDVAAVLT